MCLDNRMLRVILSDIILVFSQSSFQLPFCLDATYVASQFLHEIL